MTKPQKKAEHKTIEKNLPVLSFLAWFAVSYLVATLTINLIKIICQGLLSNIIFQLILTLSFYTLFIFILIFVPHLVFKKPLISREKLGLKDLPTWTDILLSFAGFIAYIVLAFVLIKIFENLPFYEDTPNKCEFLDNLARIVRFTILVIISPIAEEIIFRGWLYQNLRGQISGAKSKVISILLVSTIFGLIHGEWDTGVAVFAMSVIACLIRELTGTIYGSILLHMIMNALAFCSLYILQSCYN